MCKIVCVYKTGGDFDAGYVKALHQACRKYTGIDFEFVCLTDDSKFMGSDKSGIHFVRLKNKYAGWWSKIEAFKVTGPVLYLDLDTVIVSDLKKYLSYIKNMGSNEMLMLKPFNENNAMWASGIMGWNGDHSFLEADFPFWRALYEKHNDQIYISERLISRRIFVKEVQPEIGGVYSFKRFCRENGLPKDAKIVCFHGHPRPHEVTHINWVKTNWNPLHCGGYIPKNCKEVVCR